MAKNLLIVESPSKAKTLKKYLGSDFEILASYGHIRDLVPKNGAVDPDKNFAMKYQIIAKNSKHVDAIAAAVVGCAALAGGRAPILGTLLGAVFIQLMGYTLIANGISDEMTLIVTAAIIALAVWLQRGRRA